MSVRRHRLILVVCALVVSLVSGAAAEQISKLKPAGYVNDFAHVLDGRTSSDIHQLCLLIDEKAGAQIAVVTIHSLEGLEASDFANQLFKKWGVGHKDNRGVLILLAVDDHKYWVEVGYGLEPVLPDGKVGGFGREMVPFLKRGDYNNGVLLLTQRIAATIAQDRGVTLPPQTPIQAPGRQPGSRQDHDSSLPTSLILAVIVMVFYLIAAILRAVWRFLVFLITGKRPPKSRGWFGAAPGGIWIGGGSGGWSGGFGGGGGFGGFGGGMSGGGGAGGSW